MGGGDKVSEEGWKKTLNMLTALNLNVQRGVTDPTGTVTNLTSAHVTRGGRGRYVTNVKDILDVFMDLAPAPSHVNVRTVGEACSATRTSTIAPTTGLARTVRHATIQEKSFTPAAAL